MSRKVRPRHSAGSTILVSAQRSAGTRGASHPSSRASGNRVAATTSHSAPSRRAKATRWPVPAADRAKRHVFAFAEQRGMAAAVRKPGRQEPQLGAPGSPVLQKRFGAFRLEPGERRLPSGKIDRAAVVRVDEAEVPELRALVDVRHARRGELDCQLRQRRHRAGKTERRRARRQNPRENSGSARAPRTKPVTFSSYCSAGAVQLVRELRLAHGLSACRLPCARRARRSRPCRRARGRPARRRASAW